VILRDRITEPVSPDQAPRALAARNRRTAVALVGWIALLALASMAVAWFRN
jgi:hypothetical protein